MQKVMGLGQPTSQERQNKESYPILDDFHDILEDSMLIYHGEMVVIVLHEFVATMKALEHIQTLGLLF